jgi:LysR family glycine cleavage system transcriptional activator
VKNDRLPPLKALRAFEAAARHLSFSKASEELFVTPGAISQQVKTLEEYLGMSLFKRMHRRILLTDAGQCLLPGLQDGFERMAGAVGDVKSMDSDRPITISVAPSFASKWLVPRLRLLREERPDIDIRIDTSMNVVDLARSDIDIGIRFGSGKYPGMQVDLLLCEEVFPVCSPGLTGNTPLDHPADLKHFHLLHYGTSDVNLGAGWPDWQMWLMAAGASDVETRHGLTFDRQELLIQAALDGQGVALVGSVSVNDDIRNGRLIKPFGLTFPLEFSYFFVTTLAKSRWPEIAAVRDWIFRESRAYSSPYDNRSENL